MLRGKVICDKSVRHDIRDYTVQVGSVTVDITDDVRSLISELVEKHCIEHEQAMADLRAKHADILRRYHSIAEIVLAGGGAMPTAESGVTAETLTDAQIHELQIEAERERDSEFVQECRRAYRGNGGGANPFARQRLAAFINSRNQQEKA